MPPASKTTFYLDDALRARLKQVGAASKKTVTELLAEGAELVLARYESLSDREKLEKAARAARERLRQGLYRGEAVGDDVDDRVYRAGDSRAKRRTRSSG